MSTLTLLSIVAGAMLVLTAVMAAIEKRYRSFKIEERKKAFLEENASAIIRRRKERFALDKAIRAEVKASDDWKEFVNRKMTGKPVTQELREAIGFEIACAERVFESRTNTLLRVFEQAEKELEDMYEPLGVGA